MTKPELVRKVTSKGIAKMLGETAGGRVSNTEMSMRKGVGQPIGASHDATYALITIIDSVDGADRLFIDKNEEGVADGELACYLALTMAAWYGCNGSRLVSAARVESLGKALGILAKARARESPSRLLLRKLCVTDNPKSFEIHLRNTISLLSAHGIGLDFTSLAEDIYRKMQDDEADNIAHKWTKDFVKEITTDS